MSRDVVFQVWIDQRTTTGRNFKLIRDESDLDCWVSSTKELKKALLQNIAEFTKVDA